MPLKCFDVNLCSKLKTEADFNQKVVHRRLRGTLAAFKTSSAVNNSEKPTGWTYTKGKVLQLWITFFSFYTSELFKRHTHTKRNKINSMGCGSRWVTLIHCSLWDCPQSEWHLDRPFPFGPSRLNFQMSPKLNWHLSWPSPALAVC